MKLPLLPLFTLLTLPVIGEPRYLTMRKQITPLLRNGEAGWLFACSVLFGGSGFDLLVVSQRSASSCGFGRIPEPASVQVVQRLRRPVPAVRFLEDVEAGRPSTLLPILASGCGFGFRFHATEGSSSGTQCVLFHNGDRINPALGFINRKSELFSGREMCPPNYGMYCTVRLLPNVVDPSRTLVLAPTTNAVTVHLESSTNLVDWSKSASVTLTNFPTATFYRARVE